MHSSDPSVSRCPARERAILPNPYYSTSARVFRETVVRVPCSEQVAGFIAHRDMGVHWPQCRRTAQGASPCSLRAAARCVRLPEARACGALAITRNRICDAGDRWGILCLPFSVPDPHALLYERLHDSPETSGARTRIPEPISCPKGPPRNTRSTRACLQAGRSPWPCKGSCRM